MANTANLALAYLEAAQSQKHVTVNEALSGLDVLVQLSVLDRDLTAPPASPVEGDRYLVAAGPIGAWAGQEDRIAAWQAGAWVFRIPRNGWRAWVEDEALPVFYDGGAWTDLFRASASDVAKAPLGARTSFRILEESHTLALAATSDTAIQIPDRAIVFGVTVRVQTAITGAASYNCGIAGETSKYGGSLGIAAGSSNSGVTGPTAFYANTPIRFTAVGGNFTGGVVRVAIHYLTLGASL
ncbi:MAG: DUF2793 domain-containing protein [Alphaproteobacteria bacterium]